MPDDENVAQPGPPPYDPVDAMLRASLLLEQTVTFVAMMTSLRDQFIVAGWEKHTAELMAHAMYVQNGGGSR